MSVDVQVERVIHRPRPEVARYAGDPGNAPEWYANISTIEWLTPPPVGVGSRMDFVAHFLRRRIAYTYEVVELVPTERLVMRTAQGPFPMQTTYTWRDEGEHTRMTLRNNGDPGTFLRLGAPVITAAMKRAMTRDLARLAEVLESPKTDR